MEHHMHDVSSDQGACVPAGNGFDELPILLNDGLSITSSFPSSDTLVLGVVAALRKLFVESQPSVPNGMEMKHVLLLLVKLFHDLCEDMTFKKEEWLQKMEETVGLYDSIPSTLRERTGQGAMLKFAAAPWGLEKRPGQGRSNTAHTILAVYAGIVKFVKLLNEDLEMKARAGVVLKQFDVEEMQSSEEEEEEEKEKEIEQNSENDPDDSPLLTKDKFAASPKLTIHPPKAPSPPKRRPGNYNHGILTNWTVAEWVHLLKTYNANPQSTAKVVAKKHSDGYWTPKGRNVQRSVYSVRQQYKKLMGPGAREQTMGRIEGRIRELEAGAFVANYGGEKDGEGDGDDEGETG